MGKTRRRRAAATIGTKLCPHAVAKKNIGKKEEERAKEKNIAKPSSLQLPKRREAATRLLKHLPDRFTFYEFREKFRDLFGDRCGWDAALYMKLLSSVPGVYGKGQLHYVFAKMPKTSLFASHCAEVAQALQKKKFTVMEFCGRFKMEYKCRSLPWAGNDFDIKAFLDSIPQLETTEDGHLRMREQNRKEKKTAAESKEVHKESEADRRAAAIRLLRDLPSSFSILEFREKFSQHFNAPCGWDANTYKNTLSSVPGVYAREQLHYVFEKVPKESLFAVQCISVAEELNKRKFTLNDFCDRFKEKYKCRSLPWIGNDFDIMTFLVSIPELEMTDDGEFRMRGSEKNREEKKTGAVTTGITRREQVRDVLRQLPAHFAGADFQKACRQRPSLEGIGERTLRDFPGVYSTKKNPIDFYYFPTALKSGLVARQCIEMAKGVGNSIFNTKDINDRFQRTFRFHCQPWKDVVNLGTFLASLPQLEKSKSGVFRLKSAEEMIPATDEASKKKKKIIEAQPSEEAETEEDEAPRLTKEQELKTVVIDLLGQLPDDSFTRDQVENAYKKKFKKQAAISCKFLRSIIGIYGNRESKEEKFFFFPKTMKNGLFAEQCTYVAARIAMSRFSFAHFKCDFKKTFSCCRVPWQESDSTMGDYLASLPGLRRLPKKKFCVERPSIEASIEEEENIEISETVEEERRLEGEREAAGEVSTPEQDVVNVSVDILPTLPVPFCSFDFYVAYFNSVGSPFSITKHIGRKSEREFFLTLPCVYAEDYSDNYFYLPKAVDLGVFYDHCLFVWNRSPIPFDYEKFTGIFKELFGVGRLPWQEKSIWEELMEAHPRMDMNEGGKYFLKPLTYDEESEVERDEEREEEIVDGEQHRDASGIEEDMHEREGTDKAVRRASAAKEEMRFGQETDRRTTREETNKGGETIDSIEREGLEIVNEGGDEIAGGRNEEVRVPAGTMVVKQEIDEDFIVNRLVSDDDEPMETADAAPTMVLASTPKEKVVKKKRPCSVIIENGELQEATQNKQKKRRTETEEEMNEAKVSQRRSHDLNHVQIQQQDEVLLPEASTAPSSTSGTAVQVVVSMMDYAEKRGVDMDELTAAVLRTITDRL